MRPPIAFRRLAQRHDVSAPRHPLAAGYAVLDFARLVNLLSRYRRAVPARRPHGHGWKLTLRYAALPRGGRTGRQTTTPSSGSSAATLLEQNDEWTVQRARYMTLETMATLSDDPVVGLPAMVI